MRNRQCHALQLCYLHLHHHQCHRHYYYDDNDGHQQQYQLKELLLVWRWQEGWAPTSRSIRRTPPPSPSSCAHRRTTKQARISDDDDDARETPAQPASKLSLSGSAADIGVCGTDAGDALLLEKDAAAS